MSLNRRLRTSTLASSQVWENWLRYRLAQRDYFLAVEAEKALHGQQFELWLPCWNYMELQAAREFPEIMAQYDEQQLGAGKLLVRAGETMSRFWGRRAHDGRVKRLAAASAGLDSMPDATGTRGWHMVDGVAVRSIRIDRNTRHGRLGQLATRIKPVPAVYTKPNIDEVWQLNGGKNDLRLVARNLTREVYELRERIRKFEEEKKAMYTTKQLAQAYKEGELRGYLRHAIDVDATRVMDGEVAGVTIDTESEPYNHLVTLDHEYHPGNMGEKAGKIMYGAYYSYHAGMPHFDMRVY
ncbi:hypothetical protein NX059_003144 [Plenodomus lindquistii]|nr:hypothetical protein NX059_003144 [Plenodomus lindquistii]